MSLILNNIEFSYDSFSLSADMKIESGEFVSILGPSGSGKTTLLRLLAGFQQPARGRIILSGRDLTDVPTSARNIGMVFQDYALFPHLDVAGNIAYGLKSKKMNRSDIGARVSGLLETVSLSGYEKRRIGELSGGEKQRVALARALAPEPELLLFDEPLSALDMKLRKGLRREIRKIQKKMGFTAVYVTHDQEEAMSVSDRISVMNGGRVIQTGTPEQLYNRPENWFTADFIGIMNRIELDQPYMFRPEACSILNDGIQPQHDDVAVSVEVCAAEYSGGYYTCEGITEKGEKIVFYSPEAAECGRTVRLKITGSSMLNCF